MPTCPASDEIVGRHEYTGGRPHLMLGGNLHKERILAESQDPEIAILLLDFILGYNVSMDPAAELRDAIQYAKENANRRDGEPTVVVSVCGTDGDPRGLDSQIKLLKKAGTIVFMSNTRATALCCTYELNLSPII